MIGDGLSQCGQFLLQKGEGFLNRWRIRSGGPLARAFPRRLRSHWKSWMTASLRASRAFSLRAGGDSPSGFKRTPNYVKTRVSTPSVLVRTASH